MKKLILFLSVILLSYSCTSSDDSNSNNDNPSNGNVDYEFTITINGEVHKVKGNTSSIVPSGNNNVCFAQPSTIVLLRTNDVSASNYISGQNILCQLQFNNLLLGTSQANVFFISPYLDALANSLGAISSSWSSVTGPQPIGGLSQNLIFEITDLGTSGDFTTFPYNFGRTLKGSYSGTIYLANQFTVGGAPIYNVPVQLSIDFKVVRFY